MRNFYGLTQQEIMELGSVPFRTQNLIMFEGLPAQDRDDSRCWCGLDLQMIHAGPGWDWMKSSLDPIFERLWALPNETTPPQMIITLTSAIASFVDEIGTFA